MTPIFTSDSLRSFYQSLPQRTLVMGILNVTPDSFSDGGAHNTVEAALAHAQRMLAEGADIIDVGGESTRPGATPVPVEEEIARVVPVIEGLAERGAVISIDTLHAETAAAALEAGAHIINDVSGQRLTDEMVELVAESGAPYILTHARGDSQSMNSLATYEDTVGEVCAELESWLGRLMAAGVRREQLILDPGLGFAKLGQQDWELLAGLDRLQGLGYPVLVGASRKRFLACLLREQDVAASGLPLERVAERAAGERDVATAALSMLVADAGAWAVRVHNVRATADALSVSRFWQKYRKVAELSG